MRFKRPRRALGTAMFVTILTAGLFGSAHAQTAEPTPTPIATPTVSTTPKSTPTAARTTPAVKSNTATPTKAPAGRVTAKYECGGATFTNPLDKSVLIHYGTAETDSLEGSLHLEPGKSESVDSTNKAFGWTAWLEGDQTEPDVGHLWLPGDDLSCDEPDDSAEPGKPKPTVKVTTSTKVVVTAKPGTTSRGLAATGT